MNLITLTGPSCSGKTTLLNELVDNHGFASVVSHTTRPMRPGEVDGRDYYFIDGETFTNMKENGQFIENISFNGYCYGVSVNEIGKAEAEGKTSVLIVEPNGLSQITTFAKAAGINLFPIYLSGDEKMLVSRYIGRLAGENLSDKQVALRHAGRLLSLLNERTAWSPNWEMKFENIEYVLFFEDVTNENFEDTINTIKNGYAQWSKSKQ